MLEQDVISSVEFEVYTTSLKKRSYKPKSQVASIIHTRILQLAWSSSCGIPTVSKSIFSGQNFAMWKDPNPLLAEVFWPNRELQSKGCSSSPSFTHTTILHMTGTYGFFSHSHVKYIRFV
ncbi:hypothetical protein CMV_002046 [Castanea mollissima]|uniref:Uncharacterized protein n=1 Tax=Castanea mollissima TaxID=60419 RepID=A0A8J4RXM1_9ROSI|nr:hypothetical protein CMV_002046 [Castanea mollissima]